MICILSDTCNKDVFYCSTSMVAVPIKITNHTTYKIKKKTLDIIYGTCVQLDICCLLTGILLVRKNSSKASNEPSVDACTYTPRSCSLILDKADFNSRVTSSLSISTSSDFWATNKFNPAMAFSNSRAAILTPWAALISLYSTYAF